MWKDRYRCAVTLSVDFDAESLWSGTFKLATPSPLSRGDYDVRAALPRIHALLDAHELPATFMVPAQVAEEHADACAEIAARGRHEVGYHGYFHESVLELPIEQERELMKRGIARLEETFDSTPRGNRSPPFALGPNTADLLEEFDRYCTEGRFATRSEAIRQLLRERENHRIETERELATLGIDELLRDGSALVPIEWGEKFARFVRERDVEIAIERLSEAVRRITVRRGRNDK